MSGIKATTLTLFAILSLVACSDFNSPSKVIPKDPTDNHPFGESLFDENHVPRFELSVADSAWEWLEANALKKEYVPAELAIDSQIVGTVGLRYKGQFTLRNCFENGKRTCRRVSLKIKFNKFDDNLRYEGLKKINLVAFITDPHLVRNRLSYRFFREMGINAPRCNHAMVSINKKSAGLYNLIENVDGRFTKSRWAPAGDGNIYKEVWPISLSSSGYIKSLKTNEEIGDVSGMIAFASDLPKSLSDGDLQLFERYINPVEATRLIATDVAITSRDGIRTFRCKENPKSYEHCLSHNFFWHETEKGNHFSLIPWDLDQTFEIREPKAEWNDSNYDCKAFFDQAKGTPTMPEVCNPYFRMLALYYDDEYQNALQKLLDGPLAKGVPEQWLANGQKQYHPSWQKTHYTTLEPGCGNLTALSKVKFSLRDGKRNVVYPTVRLILEV